MQPETKNKLLSTELIPCSPLVVETWPHQTKLTRSKCCFAPCSMRNSISLVKSGFSNFVLAIRPMKYPCRRELFRSADASRLSLRGGIHVVHWMHTTETRLRACGIWNSTCIPQITRMACSFLRWRLQLQARLR